MFGRKRISYPTDPTVGPIETVLDRAATKQELVRSPHRWPPPPFATHALWICACISEFDAPTWLIWREEDGRVLWARKPSDAAIDEILEARLVAGGHAAPEG